MRVVRVDPETPDAAAIDDAARLLRAGELVAFPTETVYGLGARAFDPASVAKIFAAKGRPRSHPLIVHVASIEDARGVSVEWSDRADVLARAFWPGPLTLVVPRGEKVPREVTGGGETVAIRIPAHAVALAILRALGEPLCAPSANRYQTVSPTRAEHVVKSIGDAVSLVVDAGPCARGIESTVIDLTAKIPRILRPGALSIAKLRALVPDLTIEDARAERDEKRASPGMDARHYAPRAKVILVASTDEALTRATVLAREGRVAVIARDDRRTRPSADADEGEVDWRTLSSDPEIFARALFDTLHTVDDAGAKAIVIVRVPEDEAWLAVRDRLKRAAEEEEGSDA